MYKVIMRIGQLLSKSFHLCFLGCTFEFLDILHTILTCQEAGVGRVKFPIKYFYQLVVITHKKLFTVGLIFLGLAVDLDWWYWIARISRKCHSLRKFVRFALEVGSRALKKLVENAANTPNIKALIIIGADQYGLRCSIPSWTHRLT